jgi:hypothetical protein
MACGSTSSVDSADGALLRLALGDFNSQMTLRVTLSVRNTPHSIGNIRHWIFPASGYRTERAILARDPSQPSTVCDGLKIAAPAAAAGALCRRAGLGAGVGGVVGHAGRGAHGCRRLVLALGRNGHDLGRNGHDGRDGRGVRGAWSVRGGRLASAGRMRVALFLAERRLALELVFRNPWPPVAVPARVRRPARRVAIVLAVRGAVAAGAGARRKAKVRIVLHAGT